MIIESLLRKYDKIIERNIKSNMAISTGIKLPIIENGLKTGTRELLKEILYA